MKRWLIFGVVTFAALCGATPSSPPRAQAAPDAKPLTQPVQPQQNTAVKPAAVRHLSDDERAELRRQLHQFNQQYSRRQ